MIAGVADTHAALWLLFGDPRLSAAAKHFFEMAAASRNKILLAPISLAEVVYLMEKNRLPVVRAIRRIPRDAVPDMPDRIMAATGVFAPPMCRPFGECLYR